MNRQRGILPARISELMNMSKDLIPKLTEDEADEYFLFCYKLMIKHNKKLEE